MGNIDKLILGNYLLISVFAIVLILIILIIIFYKRKFRQDKQIFNGFPLKIELGQLEALKSRKVLSQKNYLKERTNLLARLGEEVLKNKMVFVYIIASYFIFVILNLSFKSNITQLAVNNIVSYKDGNILALLGILLILALLIIFRKKLIEVYNETIAQDNHQRNRLNGLINKEVYSTNGFHIGKVIDVNLIENKIQSLKIRVHKKHKFKSKGIIIDFRHVKNVGKIIIVDERILEFFSDSNYYS